MKKQLLLISILLLALVVCSCAAQMTDEPEAAAPTAQEEAAEQQQQPDQPQAEMVMIVSGGPVDYAFQNGIRAGIKRYAEKADISYADLSFEENDVELGRSMIAQARDNGAVVIVCSGQAMEAAVFEAQTLYPELSFILLDGEPHSADFAQYAVGDQTCSIFFAEQQAGFLAGYAAVKNGYTRLGFIGGMPVPSVVRFGYGYIYGARYAAYEDGKDDIQIMYHYSGSFQTTQEAQTLAGVWFNNGTELVFSCGCGDSVIMAAEAADGEVIGVDVDQSGYSDTVVISALKMLDTAVFNTLQSYYEGVFPGGQTITLTAAENGVGLSMDSLRFTDFGTPFTSEIYTTVFTKLMLGEIMPPVDTDYASAAEMGNERVAVEFVE